MTPARTRLVLELSRTGFTYRHSADGNSGLVLRLPGVRRAASFRPPAGPAGLFRSLTVRDAGKAGLEVRLSHLPGARARVFRVEAEKGKPPRLVVDLTPAPRAREQAPKPVAAPAARSGSALSSGDPDSPAGEEEAARGAESPPPVSPVVATVETTSPWKPDASNSATGTRRGPHVVVLDPGHGGHDPGATGKGLREKDVCLDVAKRMAADLNRQPGIRAVITRNDDRFISLAERMRFAEREGADLFISIHVNAAPSSRASGAEVFFLSIGAATDRAAAELARLENEADPAFVVEEDAALRGLPFVVDLRQSDTLLRSSRLAETVLDVLTAKSLAEPRGVKQAGFAVLKSYQVTSILVELGFISSPAERKKLKSPEHRQSLARAMAEGVGRYFEALAPARANP